VEWGHPSSSCVSTCALLDNTMGKAVAAALGRLPSLEHLSLAMPLRSTVRFHGDVLKGLHQLTYLELAGVKPWDDANVMRHLQVRALGVLGLVIILISVSLTLVGSLLVVIFPLLCSASCVRT
jgi:hypothetical protein